MRKKINCPECGGGLYGHCSEKIVRDCSVYLDGGTVVDGDEQPISDIDSSDFQWIYFECMECGEYWRPEEFIERIKDVDL